MSEEQQKTDILRAIYRQAVRIPLEIIDELWTEYKAFEIRLNKITVCRTLVFHLLTKQNLTRLTLLQAHKFIQDQVQGYITAKDTLNELRSHLANLFPSSVNIPSFARNRFLLPVPTSPYNEESHMLAKSWRLYLHWEEKKAANIENKSVRDASILAIYKKAVVYMRFNPETW
jgi:cleavage stimulation factor subunit 3